MISGRRDMFQYLGDIGSDIIAVAGGRTDSGTRTRPEVRLAARPRTGLVVKRRRRGCSIFSVPAALIYTFGHIFQGMRPPSAGLGRCSGLGGASSNLESKIHTKNPSDLSCSVNFISFRHQHHSLRNPLLPWTLQGRVVLLVLFMNGPELLHRCQFLCIGRRNTVGSQASVLGCGA